jgi:hypothetical protein
MLNVDLCLYGGSHLSSHLVLLLKLMCDLSSDTCSLPVLQRIVLCKLLNVCPIIQLQTKSAADMNTEDVTLSVRIIEN